MSGNEPVAPEAKDANRLLFDQLQEIDKQGGSSLNLEQREKFASGPTDAAGQTMGNFLWAQMRGYLAVVAGGHELSQKKSRIDLHERNALQGMRVITGAVNDPALCADFLEETVLYGVHSTTDAKGREAMVYQAVQLLEKPGASMDQHIQSFNSDSGENVPFGTLVVRKLEKNKSLESVQTQSPKTLQMIVAQSLASSRDNPVLGLQTKQTVDALPVPEMSLVDGQAYDVIRKQNDDTADGLWWKIADKIRTGGAEMVRINEVLKSGLALSGRVNIADCAYNELRYGESDANGALALLAEIQKDEKHDIPNRAEDSVLSTLSSFRDVVQNGAQKNKPHLVENTVAKIKNVLPQLSQPQISGFNTTRAIEAEQWQFVMHETKDREFNKAVGHFLFDLAVNPTPIHGRRGENSVDAKRQEYQQAELQKQFVAFYSVADLDTRVALKERAKARIEADPLNAQTPFDMITKGKEAFEKKQTGVKKLITFAGNKFVDNNPHEAAYTKASKFTPPAP